MQKTTNGMMPWIAMTLLAALATGCAPQVDFKQKLGEAYQELKTPAPNYVLVANNADAYLADQPTGPMAADAWYLRGRAFQEKAARDLTSPQNDWVQAHDAFSHALESKPRADLEGVIHIGLGNVLYFQDRYSMAMSELMAGIEKSDNDQDKAWALYRIGLCQQRLAQWDQADRTFYSVQQKYPSSEPAKRAHEHLGARAFWVQVGTYATASLADAVVADLKKQGVTATKFTDPSTKTPQYVRVGPLPTYDSALAVKQRIWAKYNGAIIMP